MVKIKLLNKKIAPKLRRRIKRKRKIRNVIRGTQERPRVVVYRSNKYIFVQAINDEEGKTNCSISSVEKNQERAQATKENVVELAKVFAKRLQEKQIKAVVFDRNGYKFHGVIKSFVDTLRAEGITI